MQTTFCMRLFEDGADTRGRVSLQDQRIKTCIYRQGHAEIPVLAFSVCLEYNKTGGDDMKRFWIAFAAIAVVCVILLTVFVFATGGKVKDVQIRNVQSDIFSDRDIASAIRRVKWRFVFSWRGCTLKEICYAGDEASQAELKHREKGDNWEYDEVIVLNSDFEVDDSGGDGSLEPNSNYRNWKWILARKSGGGWRLLTWGYG